MKSILGKKLGMTQVFDETGNVVPVTVIEAGPVVVTQIKTKETDGYNAVQVGYLERKEKHSNQPMKGHFSKAGVELKKHLREILVESTEEYSLGQEIKVDIFAEGEVVDVTGTTKGKGFQGVIKRHGQSRGPMGHGSHYHRRPGSMGTMRPMRVFKGKKLAGHMGTLTVTIQNLEIVAVDVENNVILISGNIPGPKKGLVLIKSAVKANGKINEVENLVSYEVEEPVVETVEEAPVAEETAEEVVETEETAKEEN